MDADADATIFKSDCGYNLVPNAGCTPTAIEFNSLSLIAS